MTTNACSVPPFPANFERDTYAVFGNPIAHSKSPLIHQAFAAQTGAILDYFKYEIPIDKFEQAVSEFFARGGKGLNITVPFKEEAWRLAEHLSIAAKTAGAVNTLYMNKKSELCGDNTDGVGMVADIKRQGWMIQNKRVLILGAGGAVKGVLQPLVDEQPEIIVIANRTPSRAKALAKKFQSRLPIQGCGYEDVDGYTQPFDLIINGSSAGLENKAPPLTPETVDDKTACYDMVYGKCDTPFIAWAKKSGCQHTADGLGMLVGQAAQSFFIWGQTLPDVGPVIKNLRAV